MNTPFKPTSLSQAQSVPMMQSLRFKILFVVLPLMTFTVAFLGVTTFFSSNNGITGIAKEFLGYKLQEVFRIAQQQVFRGSLNSELELDVRGNVLEYAKKFTDETVLIVPFNGDLLGRGGDYWASRDTIAPDELRELHQILEALEIIADKDPNQRNSWLNYRSLRGQSRVGVYLPYIDMGCWIVMLTPQNFFYFPVYSNMRYIIIILASSLLITGIVLLAFVRFLTRPLQESVKTIQGITQNLDLTRRIRVYYPDEIGVLGQYFNDMIAELENAYNQVKNYAYQTVLAKRKEERIRFIFQKYVPSDVIDHVLNRSSESLLVGNKQRVSILFSDIRDFTTISEQLKPDDLVYALNAYFNQMVDEVLSRHGIIDKFIGDAIMALFGAPKGRAEDADNAVESALGMIKALMGFNALQAERGRTQFQIGVGVNTGDAIVGNIGSEQKVDFTVIGDSVNLASRLEGLTKSYHAPVLITQFTREALVHPQKYIYIDVDAVKVKGKDAAVKIYQPVPREDLQPGDEDFYLRFDRARALYTLGNFSESLQILGACAQERPDFYLAGLYIERCLRYKDNPPQNWDGVEKWTTK